MEQEIQNALAVLKDGGIILYPTDTVWGIGCDATNAQAVAKIYALKQRDDALAMIVLVNNLDNVARWVKEVPEVAWQLLEVADKPLTLILPNAVGVASNLLPPTNTIAIRVPNHEFCKKLSAKLGRPLVSTSANIHGQPTPIHFEDIAPEILKGVDHIVPRSMEDPNATGAPSSIISLGISGEIKIIRA